MITLSVHPHVCGEHGSPGSRPPRLHGSSPRMWGTSGRTRLTTRRRRFIPTYVGNMMSAVPMSVPSAVHPHVCGEHFLSILREQFLIGSSPRMWGTCLSGMPGQLPDRFIPTYVGNIAAFIADRAGLKVHPHVCGEHLICRIYWISNFGSSPRMWGTSFGGAFYPRGNRFIPTYVGNIAFLTRPGGAISVHPHVCGEHFFHQIIEYN